MRWVFFVALVVLTIACVVLLASHEAYERPSLDAPVQLATEISRGAARLVQEPVVLTEKEERRAGEKILDSVREGLLRPTDPRAKYVVTLGRRLAAELGSSRYRYEFHVIHHFEPNAFALPGGIVLVTTPLLEFAEFEAELSCILGHEIMHIERGHWREALKSRVAGKGTDWEGIGELIYTIFRIGFSQAQETEADRHGVTLAAEAGYAPLAGVSLFEKFERSFEKPREPWRHRCPDCGKSPDRVFESALKRYLATHPPARERMETVRQAVRDHRSRWIRRRFYWGRENLRRRTPRQDRHFEREFRGLEERP